LGFLTVASRAQPLAFFLKHAPLNASGERVQVGDCFEFNISEANAGSKKERAQQRGGHDEPAQAHAVRLSSLERDAVQDVEFVDRSRKVRGFISQMPEKGSSAAASSGGKGGKSSTSASKPGVVIVLPADRPAAVTNSALTHPGSWALEASAAWAIYSAAGIHAASISAEAPKSEGEEKYQFTLRELGFESFVSKGDLVDFYLSVRTVPSLIKRPVEFSLVPLQGSIETIVADKSSPGAYTGTLTVYNPQAPRAEESFFFSSRDVMPTGEGAAAAVATPLAPGDFVEFSDMVLNAELKKRQARNIVRAKDTRPPELRPSVKRKVGAPIIVASRFARGPDATGIGFAPRRSQQPSRSPSSSPQPA
jgi:urease beta subunit